MLSLTLLYLLLCFFVFVFLYKTLLQLTLIHLLTLHLCLLFSFLLQSKHKEDAPTTRLILLDEPEFKVRLLPFLLLFFLFGTYFLYHMPLGVSFPSQHHCQL